MGKKLSFEQRIMSKVRIEVDEGIEGCWVWTGATIAGYPILKDSRTGKNLYVRRIIMEQEDSGLMVRAKCRRLDKLCVNPDHLIIVHSQAVPGKKSSTFAKTRIKWTRTLKEARAALEELEEAIGSSKVLLARQHLEKTVVKRAKHVLDHEEPGPKATATLRDCIRDAEGMIRNAHALISERHEKNARD